MTPRSVLLRTVNKPGMDAIASYIAGHAVVNAGETEMPLDHAHGRDGDEDPDRQVAVKERFLVIPSVITVGHFSCFSGVPWSRRRGESVRGALAGRPARERARA